MMSTFRAKDLLVSRKAHDLTQAEAAEKIGCGLRTFITWENGDATPHNFWSDRLANFCEAASEVKARTRLRRSGTR